MLTKDDAQKEPDGGQSIHERRVLIELKDVSLGGTLNLPEGTQGLVIFAHGRGSSRYSPRNCYVAGILNQHQPGTLLIDLLSHKEERLDQQTRRLRFNVPMLSDRLVSITNWANNQTQTRKLKLGYFRSSAGGGAALIAAAPKTDIIAAVVSRGSRPDLAGNYLSQVKAPTLLMVGECDPQVIELNKQALNLLNDQSKLDIIAGLRICSRSRANLKPSQT